MLIGQPLELALLLEQLEAHPLVSLTAPGAAVFEPLIGMSQPELALLLEQLEAHPLVSLTAPGAAVLEPLIGHWGALSTLEQLEAQSLDSLTAPGEAVSLLQQVSVVEQQLLEVDTAPRAALSSVCLLLSQAARTLRSAAAAKVVRVRVMA